MDAFSPELAQHWLAAKAAVADEPASGRDRADDLSPAQQVALEELIERVMAARSVF